MSEKRRQQKLEENGIRTQSIPKVRIIKWSVGIQAFSAEWRKNMDMNIKDETQLTSPSPKILSNLYGQFILSTSSLQNSIKYSSPRLTNHNLSFCMYTESTLLLNNFQWFLERQSSKNGRKHSNTMWFLNKICSKCLKLNVYFTVQFNYIICHQ